jgi:hypothetical protein
MTIYKPYKATLIGFNANPCKDTLARFGYSLDRALAVPISITGTPVTKLPETLGEAISQIFVLQNGGNVGILQPPAWWDVPPGDDQLCADTTGGELAEQWPNIRHGIDGSVLGFILIPNAITPNDPKGAQSVAHYLAFRPSLIVGTVQPPSQPTKSDALVHCNGTTGPVSLDWYIASDPDYAAAAGCKHA